MSNQAFAAYNIHSNTAANRPATPTIADGQLYMFQATDTGVVSVWNGTAWVDIQRNASANEANIMQRLSIGW